MEISLIAAASENNALGRDGKLPWGLTLKSDLKRFKELTANHVVIMGRKTFESIGRPLPNRTNIIVSRNPSFSAPGCSVVDTLEKALGIARGQDETETFIIGGESLFKEALTIATKIYLTRVAGNFEADTYFPALPLETWELVESVPHGKDQNNAHDYTFETYRRK